MDTAQVEIWNSWHGRHEAPGDDEPQVALRRQFLGAVAVGGQVAELGCGQGHDAVAFAAAGLGVTALDFSPVAVEQVRERAGRLGVPVLVVRHDLSEPLPFEERSLDGVYAHLSLHYFDDATTRRVFAGIARVLAPGGVLVFSVKSTDDPCHGEGEPVGPRMFRVDGKVRHFFDREYLDGLLGEWEVEEVRSCRGYYASREPSAFLQVVARTRR